jgi:hypothetical protein
VVEHPGLPDPGFEKFRILKNSGQIDPDVRLLDWSIFEWDIRINPEVIFRINPDLPQKKRDFRIAPPL